MSPRIFKINLNDPNVIFRVLGKDDSCEKPEAKNFGILSLYFKIPVANVCFYLLNELLLADLLPDAMMCDFLSQSMLAGGWARTRHMIL
jgi:hypothetical protein